jgi:xanthine dehydrogenase YagT iron-sulfur-binding subunit
MPDDDLKDSSPQLNVSRRDFLKLGTLAAAAPAVLGPQTAEAQAQPQILGPGPVPVTLTINNKKFTAQLEPRVTLLDAMRERWQLTGAKRVCDRGECGACTVIMDGRAVYACSILAIDAQGKQITTVESLGSPENMHPIQRAFVDHDASQCGFCTPGFVMAAKAVLDKHPHPTEDQIIRGMSGNFCRCGTYHGLRAAMMQVSGNKPAGNTHAENHQPVAPARANTHTATEPTLAEKGA